MYQLLGFQEFQKANLFIKEWRVRINNNLIYVFTIQHDVDYKNIKLKLNNITLEEQNKQNYILSSLNTHQQHYLLPITIEAYQFQILIAQNQSQLFVNGNNILLPLNQPQIPAQIKPSNDLDYEDLLNKIVECDSILSELHQFPQEQQTQMLLEQIQVLQTLQQRTQNREYLQKIKDKLNQIDDVLDYLSTLQQPQPQPQQPPSPPPPPPPPPPPAIEECCIICMDKEITFALVPCGHQKYCEECAQACLNNKQCALCQEKIIITQILRIFR